MEAKNPGTGKVDLKKELDNASETDITQLPNKIAEISGVILKMTKDIGLLENKMIVSKLRVEEEINNDRETYKNADQRKTAISLKLYDPEYDYNVAGQELGEMNYQIDLLRIVRKALNDRYTMYFSR